MTEDAGNTRRNRPLLRGRATARLPPRARRNNRADVDDSGCSHDRERLCGADPSASPCCPRQWDGGKRRHGADGGNTTGAGGSAGAGCTIGLRNTATRGDRHRPEATRGDPGRARAPGRHLVRGPRCLRAGDGGRPTLGARRRPRRCSCPAVGNTAPRPPTRCTSANLVWRRFARLAAWSGRLSEAERSVSAGLFCPVDSQGRREPLWARARRPMAHTCRVTRGLVVAAGSGTRVEARAQAGTALAGTPVLLRARPSRRNRRRPARCRPPPEDALAPHHAGVAEGGPSASCGRRVRSESSVPAGDLDAAVQSSSGMWRPALPARAIMTRHRDGARGRGAVPAVTVCDRSSGQTSWTGPHHRSLDGLGGTRHQGLSARPACGRTPRR